MAFAKQNGQCKSEFAESLPCPVCDTISPRFGTKDGKGRRPRYRCPACAIWFDAPFDSRQADAGRGGRS